MAADSRFNTFESLYPEPALTRGDLERIRGKDLRPVLPPEPKRRTTAPKGHGNRYRWLKGCRCSWCRAAYDDYLAYNRERQRRKRATP